MADNNCYIINFKCEIRLPDNEKLLANHLLKLIWFHPVACVSIMKSGIVP